jgi:hypothetical protein
MRSVPLEILELSEPMRIIPSCIILLQITRCAMAKDQG